MADVEDWIDQDHFVERVSRALHKKVFAVHAFSMFAFQENVQTTKLLVFLTERTRLTPAFEEEDWRDSIPSWFKQPLPDEPHVREIIKQVQQSCIKLIQACARCI